MPDTAPTIDPAIAVTGAANLNGFNYDGIDPKTKEGLRADAERIRQWTGEASQRIFWIGRKLILAKALLLHGQFGPWLSSEFGWSERTAQRYMQAAEVFEGKSDTVSVLEPTAVYALSAPSTPKAVRETVVTRLEAGERPKLQEITAEVAAARRQVQQDKAQQKAERQTRTGLPPAPKPAEVRGRDAAVFILKHLGEHSVGLMKMLEGANAEALLSALCKGDVTPVKGLVQSLAL